MANHDIPEAVISAAFKARYPRSFVWVTRNLMTWCVTVQHPYELAARTYTGFIQENGINFVNTIFLPYDQAQDILVARIEA